jgi:hypothetical protein
MSQARYITLATLSLIAAIFVADGTLLESAPDWIKGVLIGAGSQPGPAPYGQRCACG